MIEFNFTAYMKDIASRHAEIKHTDEDPHFFRIAGVGQLDQFLAKINRVVDPAICVDVNPDGQVISPQVTNTVDVPNYRFFVLKKAGNGVFEDIESAKKESKTLGMKILAKLKHDKYLATMEEVDNGLFHLDLNFGYQVIGPLAQSWYGCMFTFRIQQSAKDAGMVYNADEYTT